MVMPRRLLKVDVETLEAIEELNFENWMHYYKELVSVLYRKPKDGSQLHGDGRFGKGISLTKTLNRGLEFGALDRYKSKGKYHLTEKARKFYEEHLKEDT